MRLKLNRLIIKLMWIISSLIDLRLFSFRNPKSITASENLSTRMHRHNILANTFLLLLDASTSSVSRPEGQMSSDDIRTIPQVRRQPERHIIIFEVAIQWLSIAFCFPSYIARQHQKCLNGDLGVIVYKTLAHTQ